MAAYAVTDTVATYNTAEEAAAAMEVAVELLDSTANPIVCASITMTADNRWVMVLVA